MATRITSAARQTALEIGDKPAAFLTNITLPRIDWPRAASATPAFRGGASASGPFAASLGPFVAAAAIVGAGELLDWLLSPSRGKLLATSGAVIETDLDFGVQRRIDWTGGVLTEIHWPVLDARESKKPFGVVFKWQPATIEFGKGSGKVAAVLGAKAKAWRVSNFRVSLGAGAIDSKLVSRVEMPTVRANGLDAAAGRERRPTGPGGFDLGRLRIGFTGAGRDAALDFARNAMKTGVRPASDNIDIVIEMLDALKKTLGTFHLGGCLLLAYEEPASDSQAERAAETMLTFSVGSFDFQT